MAGVDDNLDDIGLVLDELADTLDFTRAGREGSLGEQLAGVVVEGIVDRNRAAIDPDGNDWPENQGKYGERKDRYGLPVGVGLYAGGRAGGEMVSMEQVQGEVEISPDEVTLSYGTHEEARRKGSWFTRGSDGPGEGEVSGAPNQPPRPFYAMGEEDLDRLVEEAGHALDDLLAAL